MLNETEIVKKLEEMQAFEARRKVSLQAMKEAWEKCHAQTNTETTALDQTHSEEESKSHRCISNS